MKEIGIVIILISALMIFIGLLSVVERSKHQQDPIKTPPSPTEGQSIQLVEPIASSMQVADYFVARSASPAKAFTLNSDGNVIGDNNPTFQIVYNSVDVQTKIHFAIVHDTQTGVEYVVMRTEEGGITVTPRFHPDQKVEK